MKRVWIALLLLITVEFAFAQAEIYGNCFYQNTTGRVVIRLGIRNKTNSQTGQMKLAGMRFGFQFNTSEVTYAGYRSYMTLNGQPETGLEDNQFIDFIGKDTEPNAADIDNSLGSSRTATIIGSDTTKVMQMRYINRSTPNCGSTITVNPGEIKVLLDIYFTLNKNNPAFYKLLQSDYGFNDPQFIAQFLQKNDGGHFAPLLDTNKEIGVTVIRSSNTINPYQPFNGNDCSSNSNKLNPIPFQEDDVRFINPINGILSCRFGEDYFVNKKQNTHQIFWKVCNNELLDKIEVRKRVGDAAFKTVSLQDARDIMGTVDYHFMDPVNTAINDRIQYQVVLHARDGSQIFGKIISPAQNTITQNQLDLYPNPVQDKVQFNLPIASSVYQIRFFDITGRIWLNQQVVGGGVQQINISLLPKGVYAAEAINIVTGQKYQSRFVKE